MTVLAWLLKKLYVLQLMTYFWHRHRMVMGTGHTLTCELAFWHPLAVFAAAIRPKLYPRRGTYSSWICKGALLHV